MSYRNVLLRAPKVNVPAVPAVEPIAPAAPPPPNLVNNPNTNNNNNNSNWLSKIQVNIPVEAEPFRNVNFPSPHGPNNKSNKNNYDSLHEKEELTNEEKRLIAEDPAAFLVLPPTLYIKEEPYFIYSQHYGECATDSFLNILFFADGYREYFGQKADVLYKRLRQEHRYDLLHYTPYFKEQVRELYQLVNGNIFSKKQFEDIVDIFARIVRRFIFVNLLNYTRRSSVEKISEIIETSCPPRVKKTAVRRKSINAMAGIDIHDAILEFMGDGKREKKKNNSNELETVGLTTLTIHNILSWFLAIVFAPRSKHFYYEMQPFNQTETIQPYLPNLKAVYLSGSSSVSNTIGHAVALFCHSGIWYIADNNLGIALELEEFEPAKYFGEGVLSQFFLCDFTEINTRELLRGNHGVKVHHYNLDQGEYRPYAIEEFRTSIYYGFYIYEDGNKENRAQQIVLAIHNKHIYPCKSFKETFGEDQRIYFFAFDTDQNGVERDNEAEVNPNLPVAPLKRNRLKKTKRRGRSKGKRRTTQRAKPPRANQTRVLEGQVNNVREARNNVINEHYNHYFAQNYGLEKPAPKLTLGNFLGKK